ncbi:MAG: hypothetical protein BWY79_00409 [Actinobacteria bacterium ADurb.Bin444]|nr:MAG: hypothetical protein BWY79_00409 [Actinobacteria bacterium ADurb.Bin444]
MGQKPQHVQIDRVASHRLHYGHTRLQQPFPEVPRLLDPVLEIALLNALHETPRQRLQIAAGETPVGEEALAEDHHDLHLIEEGGITTAEQPADID